MSEKNLFLMLAKYLTTRLVFNSHNDYYKTNSY